MEAITAFFSFIQGLGVNVMMPILLTIFGTILGAGFGKSLKAGLTVGVGFIGLNLIINNVLGTSLAPAVQEMTTRFGLALNIIDVGWPASSAIAMGTTIGMFIIPLGLLVNILMLVTNTTQTIDVDIWNYWHFAFTGSIVAIITGDVMLGFAAAVINMVVVLIPGDITAPQVEKSLGMPGVSLPHGFTAAFAPIAMFINWVIDKIPGVRDINLDVESMQKKFGVFGEPLMGGTVIGLIIGCIAYFDVAVIAGSVPVILGSAVGVGHPVTLSLALILIPVMLLLAVALQPLGNQVIPFGDLSTATYMLVLITPIVNNNGFRGLIVGIVVLAIGLLISTYMAPFQTAAALQAGFDVASYAGSADALISSLCDGANPLTFIFVFLSNINGWVCIGVTGVAAIVFAIWNRMRILKEAKELHEEA